MKKSILLFGTVALMSVSSILSQTLAERQVITANYDQQALTLLEDELRQKFETNQRIAFEMAAQNGWETEIALPNGGNALLVGVFDNGTPKYYTTDNREGTITTRTDRVHTGGVAGLDLNGENMIGGVWDGGRVRNTHNLLEERALQIDNPGSISNHATHVSGTMIGSGSQVNGQAKGMAPMAELIAYDFGADEPEMTSAASDGLLISNHSYGIASENVPLWYIGYYDGNARDIDRIVYNAPYYLPVCSAGNDRQSGENPSDGGYDYLTDKSVAKNNIVVAATFEVLNYEDNSDVFMSSFSSWGPTDDGRIKPDISAKGVNMYSCSGTSNASYMNMSGTSMSAPNVSGSLLLLQQHYNNLNGEYMLASTLRALALHTADEAGFAPGPDYRFGWGLLNTEHAAQVISENSNQSLITTETLDANDEYTYTFQADGTQDIVATIAWTDPAADLLPGGNEDLATPSLMNDLDLRISNDGGETFLPWVLNVASPTAPATTGDNIVDNVEKIEINAPAPGEYIVRVSHKGQLLVNDTQVFSLVIEGISNEDFMVSTTNANVLTCSEFQTATFDIDVTFDAGFNDTVALTFDAAPEGTTATITPSSVSETATAVLIIEGIDSLENGSYPITITATGSSQTTNTYVSLEITDDIQVGLVTLDSPTNNSQNRPIDGLELEWDPTSNATLGYEYEVALDDAFVDVVITGTTLELVTTLTGLTYDTEYFWRVRGLNECSSGDYEEFRRFITEAELATNDNQIESLMVYPNPTNALITIESPVSTLERVSVYSITGVLLLDKEVSANTTTLDVSGFASGTYFVKATSKNASSVIQVLKN
ncbi:MAG: C5a peptidase [Flavobacteriaceae bacterium]|nr:MAG: C5a peptidase [Flavobacteriaceae bacterium]